MKKTVSIHPAVYFNKTLVNSTTTHKHIGKILNFKIKYKNYLQSVFSRVNKTNGLLRKEMLIFNSLLNFFPYRKASKPSSA